MKNVKTRKFDGLVAKLTNKNVKNWDFFEKSMKIVTSGKFKGSFVKLDEN